MVLAHAGGKKRTFEPYKYQDKVQAELLAVMAASILMSVSEGSHTANIKSIDKLSFSHLWLASGIRCSSPVSLPPHPLSPFKHHFSHHP